MMELPRYRIALARLLMVAAVPLLAAACASQPGTGGAPVAQLAADGSPPPSPAPTSAIPTPATMADTATQANAFAARRIEPEEYIPGSGPRPVRIALAAASSDTLFAARARTLEQSMQSMLAANGYEVIAPPDRLDPADAIYLLAADMTVSDAGPGGQHVRIDWHIEDASGEPVGRITQQRSLKAGAGARDWERHAALAAAAAAEGVNSLVRTRAR